MSLERVATNSHSGYMLQQIAKANIALQKTEAQVASGKVSDNYTGIGDKTAALEGARAAADRATAYQQNTQLAMTQADMQDSQLTSLAGLAQQLQKAIQTAAGNADGTGLMDTANSIFQQAATILNSTDSSGNYIYGGQKSDVKPFTASTLADLAAAPSVAGLFQNGNIKKTVQVGDGQTETIGVLASDVGTGLMSALKDLYNVDGGTGTLAGQLSTSQIDSIAGTPLTEASKAATDLNTVTAENGNTYNALKSSVTTQESVANLYTGFVSNIEDVDMASALTNLNANQTALQAVLQVTAKLNNLSLLNYIPAG